jgi:hypothetical protein
MTSKLNYQAMYKKGIPRFPDFPPRDDMQNPLHLFVPGYLTTLSRHFGSPETNLVLSEVPLGHSPTQRQGILVPDLTIAFGVNVEQILAQHGYAIDDQGKPPHFVLEVASPTTSRNDIGLKRDGYQTYGVLEYWRYDGSGGQYYPQALSGDRLADGAYQAIPIETDGAAYWGHSETLGLTVCWEDRKLRWWDPVQARYLATHAEEAEAVEAEREARLSAEERVRQLEDEVARLRRPDTSPSA